MIDGNLNGVEIKAIADPAKTGEQTNVAHLELTENNSGKSAKSATDSGKTIQSDKFHIPAVVPVGSTSLEFYIKNNADRINDVNIWFVPDVKESK
jgi:hypothetical protein